MDDVYVVEVASTGPAGIPNDEVAEIAVCRVFSDGSDFDTVYNDGVALDPRDLGKEPLDFMHENFGIEPEDLYGGSPRERVASDFQKVVFGKECTSYNVGAVFGRYLSFEPWDSTRNLTLLPSISVRMPSDLRGPPDREHVLIKEAYDRLCPGDPVMIGGGRRAIHLAQMSASVLAVLRREGLFRSEPHLHDRDAEDDVGERYQVHDRVEDVERDRYHP